MLHFISFPQLNLSKMKTLCFTFLFFYFLFHTSHSQQPYVNNKQLNCDTPNSVNDGFLCNGPQPSCLSYLTFRTQPPYDSASTIGYLFKAEPSVIAQLNNINDVDRIPTNTLIIVPITNCTCSGKFYQHNSTYTLKYSNETYFSLANNTYQGLTTCQALMNQNPTHGARALLVGMQISVPLRCACPSRNQTDNGVKFLLSYLVNWGDTVTKISERFGVDVQSTLDANELAFSDLIFPFTPILVPLKAQPTYNTTHSSSSSPPPPPPIIISPPAPPPTTPSSSSNKKWVFVGIGIGSVLFIVILGLCLCLFLRRRTPQPASTKLPVSSNNYTPTSKTQSDSIVSSENVRFMIDSSLNVYNFEELEKATEFFSEENRIKGSIYRGVIKGDYAAIKRTRGGALDEINVLKQIHHSSIIKLSGYCIHEGNTYYVYEYAENGSLSDWLHEKKSCQTPSGGLGWKQRIQIAYDVADGLNYLHNYASPPYIHKDLKCSNVLLNAGFRAKISNFGTARKMNDDVEDDTPMHLTRHVVGTQGYMAPEYVENGVVTPKIDVFAFGVVMLELLSGREAITVSDARGNDGNAEGESLLSTSINQVLEGENVREKLKNFIDPSLERDYPLDLAFSMAQLAKSCVAWDLDLRPTMYDVFIYLSKILSSSLDWDSSEEFQRSTSITSNRGR